LATRNQSKAQSVLT